MVSDPIERFVTLFKQSRLSAHWRPRFTDLSEQDRSVRLKAVLNSEWAHKNLSACVLGDDPECVPPPGSIATSLVSHFCGPDPTCR